MDQGEGRYEEVFGKFISVALVLIEKHPGSGKTTLVHKVTSDWAKQGSVLKNAKVVFLIFLNNLARVKDERLSDILEPFMWSKKYVKSCSVRLTHLMVRRCVSSLMVWTNIIVKMTVTE